MVDGTSERYDALMAECNAVTEQLATVNDKNKHFKDAVEKAQSWLQHVRDINHL